MTGPVRIRDRPPECARANGQGLMPLTTSAVAVMPS